MKVEFRHTIEGERVSEKEFLKRSVARKKKGTPNLSRSEHWKKHESFGLACHPMQVKEFNKRAKAAGTGIVYSPDGMPHGSGKGQFRAEIKHRGFYNQDDIS